MPMPTPDPVPPLVVTECSVTLVPAAEARNGRIRAFARLVLNDQVVINDIRVVAGNDRLLVAMPSRPRCRHCPRCGGKAPYVDPYCSRCGRHLGVRQPPLDDRGRTVAHADVVHPINAEGHTLVREAVLAAYRRELDAAAAEVRARANELESRPGPGPEAKSA